MSTVHAYVVVVYRSHTNNELVWGKKNVFSKQFWRTFTLLWCHVMSRPFFIGIFFVICYFFSPPSLTCEANLRVEPGQIPSAVVKHHAARSPREWGSPLSRIPVQARQEGESGSHGVPWYGAACLTRWYHSLRIPIYIYSLSPFFFGKTIK